MPTASTPGCGQRGRQVPGAEDLRVAHVDPRRVPRSLDDRGPVLDPLDDAGPGGGGDAVGEVVLQVEEHLGAPGVPDELGIADHQLAARGALGRVGPVRLVEALEQHDAHAQCRGRTVFGVPTGAQRVDDVEGVPGVAQAAELCRGVGADVVESAEPGGEGDQRGGRIRGRGCCRGSLRGGGRCSRLGLGGDSCGGRGGACDQQCAGQRRTDQRRAQPATLLRGGGAPDELKEPHHAIRSDHLSRIRVRMTTCQGNTQRPVIAIALPARRDLAAPVRPPRDLRLCPAGHASPQVRQGRGGRLRSGVGLLVSVLSPSVGAERRSGPDLAQGLAASATRRIRTISAADGITCPEA